MIIIIRCPLCRSTFRIFTDFYEPIFTELLAAVTPTCQVEGGSDILRKESRKLRHEVVRVGSEVIANFIDTQCQVKYSTKKIEHGL